MRTIYLGLLFLTQFSIAQTFVSVKAWPMPGSAGLVAPGFRVVPQFSIESIGSEYKSYLVLKMDITLASPGNPVAPYTAQYMYGGKIYTDQQLGMEPFYPIKLSTALFRVLVQGPLLDIRINYERNIGRYQIAEVPKDARASSYAAYVEGLESVSYGISTGNIERAILNYETVTRKKLEDEKKVEQSKIEIANKKIADEKKKIETEMLEKKDLSNKIESKLDKKEKNSFWTEKKSENVQSIPLQANHKNLPNLVRTTDGGYFKRSADGKFKEVTKDEFMKAKESSTKTGNIAEAEQAVVSTEKIRSQVSKMFDDAAAQNKATNQLIDQKVDMYRQNFYYAEAIRNGKQNLAILSTLDGNYQSIQALLADFTQKNNAIRNQVQSLEQARNAQLNNAVTGTFNGNSTEQAIGQGIQVIGNMFNAASAAKEQREAREALQQQKQAQLVAIDLAKKNARRGMRNQLLESFPSGGTPLTMHKVSLPEVFMFAYIINPSLFEIENATVAVSNVFPIQQYSDGTFPYKTNVLSKLNGYGTGEVKLVGYYGDKEKAEQMRKAFVQLATRSELIVLPFSVKIFGSSVSSKLNGSEDFWGKGKKDTSIEKGSEIKTGFWKN